jgi:hypothetical protein
LVKATKVRPASGKQQTEGTNPGNLNRAQNAFNASHPSKMREEPSDPVLVADHQDATLVELNYLPLRRKLVESGERGALLTEIGPRNRKKKNMA